MKPARLLPVVVCGLIVVPLLSSSQAYGQKKRKAKAGMAVWDTGSSSQGPLVMADFARNTEWKRLSPRKDRVTIQGDAVMTNGRVVAVVRQQASAVEFYSIEPETVRLRARLQLLGPEGESGDRLEDVSLVENTRGAATLRVSYAAEDGGTLTANFRMKRGDISLETQPVSGVARLRVDCPGRFAVLPDFFADDIMIDAREIPLSTIDVPSEHLLLHLTGDHDAIAMCVFESGNQDIRLRVSEESGERVVTGSEIDFGDGKRVWVALVTGPQVWHELVVTADQAEAVTPLDWEMPYPAQWRIDFTTTKGLVDSWEMLLADKDGEGFIKHTWMGRGADHLNPKRKRWTTVLGYFPYPIWTDEDGRGYLQALKHEELTFRGPAVVYPINRVGQTPVNAFTVVDVLRNALGVGPCEYILDLEGQEQEELGRATCSVQGTLDKIYENGEQKKKREEVEKALDDALVFVKHIRSRIRRFIEFGKNMRAYLAEQKAQHPELAEPIEELEELVQEIDVRVEARRDKIQTPAYVARMNDEFRENVLGYMGPDALERCQEYTKALVVIGDNQDELSGECRWAVKALRQRSALMLAEEPRLAEVVAEIRERSQEALRNPSTHEGERH